MGQSLILIQKKPLELSVEIDRDICIEISNGFNGPDVKWSVGSRFEVSLEDLKEIANNLAKVISDLENSWVCQSCRNINHESENCCSNCEDAKPKGNT